MSIYFEFLMDLWRKDTAEFFKQVAKLLNQLSPEEANHVIELFVRSLPLEVLAKACEEMNEIKDQRKHGTPRVRL